MCQLDCERVIPINTNPGLPDFLLDFYQRLETNVLASSEEDRERVSKEIENLKEVWRYRMGELLEAVQDKNWCKKISDLSVRVTICVFFAEAGISVRVPKTKSVDLACEFHRRIACSIMHQVLPFIGQHVSFDVVSNIPWRIPLEYWPRDSSGHFRKFTEAEFKLVGDYILEVFEFLVAAADRKRELIQSGTLQREPSLDSTQCQSSLEEGKKSLTFGVPKRASFVEMRKYARLISQARTTAGMDHCSRKHQITAEEELKGLEALMAVMRDKLLKRCSGKLVVVLARDGLILSEFEMYLRELGKADFTVCSVYQPGSPFSYGQNKRNECLSVKALRIIGEKLFAECFNTGHNGQEDATELFKARFKELILNSSSDLADSQLQTTKLQELKKLLVGTELESLSDEQLKNLIRDIRNHCDRLASRVEVALRRHRDRFQISRPELGSGDLSEIIIFDTYGTGKTALIISAILESVLQVKTSVVLAQQKVVSTAGLGSSSIKPFRVECLIDQSERAFPEFDWPIEYNGGFFVGESKLQPYLRTVARSLQILNDAIDEAESRKT